MINRYDMPVWIVEWADPIGDEPDWRETWFDSEAEADAQAERLASAGWLVRRRVRAPA